MPSYLIKVNKEEDFYCVWSTVTDSPHYWGRGGEVAQRLLEYYPTGCSIGTALREISERFERADEHGTSAMAYKEFYGWDDSGFIYDQLGWLPRKKLGEFLRSYDHGEDRFDLSILEPFED